MKLTERLETLLSPPSEISSEWLNAIFNALLVVRRFKDPRATDILLRALQLWETDKTNSGTQIRKSIIDTLGKLNDSKAFEPLLKGLNDTDAEVRSRAVQCLYNLKAVDSLIIALADTDEFVRERAATCLGKLEDSKVVEPLSKLLEDSSFLVREAAQKAIAEFSK